MSMTTASPTVCPARLVPPPRGRTGTLKSRAISIVGENIFMRPRDHNTDRLDFINAGVGAVHQPRSAVEANFALDAGFQRLDKDLHS